MNKPENIAALREVLKNIIQAKNPDGDHSEFATKSDMRDYADKALALLDKLLSEPEPNNVGDEELVNEIALAVVTVKDWVARGDIETTCKNIAKASLAAIRQHIAAKKLGDWFDDAVFERAGIKMIASAYPADGWQPIETAPRDGTLILLYDPDEMAIKQNQDIFIGFTFGYSQLWRRIFDEGRAFYVQPTMWQPLPQPPKEKK